MLRTLLVPVATLTSRHARDVARFHLLSAIEVLMEHRPFPLRLILTVVACCLVLFVLLGATHHAIAVDVDAMSDKELTTYAKTKADNLSRKAANKIKEAERDYAQCDSGAKTASGLSYCDLGNMARAEALDALIAGLSLINGTVKDRFGSVPSWAEAARAKMDKLSKQLPERRERR